MRWLALFFLLIAASGSAHAHEVRPGFLTIDEGPAGVFSARLRQPILAIDDGAIGGLDLKLRFPSDCEVTQPSVYDRADGYLTERLAVTCPGGLLGHPIMVEGLRGSITDIYVTYSSATGQTQNDLLTAQRPEFRPGERSSVNVFGYLRMGIEHLLGGIDHVLFVLGLILIVARFQRLLWVATAFTLSHSLTLGLATLDVVRLSSPPVEAAIALSILFLAFELSRREEDSTSIARRHPEWIALGFGLLHGFGFASVLSEAGLPPGQIVPALFLFNVGVEIGQIGVISLVCGTLLLAKRAGPTTLRVYRSALIWTLGIGAAYFFVSAFLNLL